LPQLSLTTVTLIIFHKLPLKSPRPLDHWRTVSDQWAVTHIIYSDQNQPALSSG